MGKKHEEHMSLFGYVNTIYHYVMNLKFLNQVLPSKKANTSNLNTNLKKSSQVCKEQNKEVEKDLFPKGITYNKDLLKDVSAIPCSMDISKISKVINSDGTISWDINNTTTSTTASQQNQTSPFLTSTGSTISTADEMLLSPNTLKSHTPSPPFTHNINSLMSAKHNVGQNNDTTTSNSKYNTIVKEETDMNSNHSSFDDDDDEDLIPDLPHPDFFELKSESSTPLSTSSTSQSPNSTTSTSNSSGGRKANKIYSCEYCNAEFRIKGYLTRHIKKHAITKAYECPFFDPTAENKCHPNGGFSRRDTYKTHLKARHFKYPQGTRSQDRVNTPGKCGMCNKPYQSNEDWVEHHIENGECELLPNGYEGRVKNSRRRNYEFPTNENQSNHQYHSSGHVTSHSNSSAEDMTPPEDSSRVMSSLKSTMHDNKLRDEQIFTNGKMGSNIGQIIMKNDYDENDEFSLDTEQCYSFSRW